MIEGKKKMKTIHHDRLKSCKDVSFPLWFQQKRHKLLSDILVCCHEEYPVGFSKKTVLTDTMSVCGEDFILRGKEPSPCL